MVTPNRYESMNADSERDKDPVRQALREWRIKAPVPPRFQEQVWRCIEKQESMAPHGYWLGLQRLAAQLFARRAWVTGYVGVALVAGLSLGYWRADEQVGSLNARLGHQYIQSVDPYQKTGR
jgi:hypothetical protein